MIRTQTKAMRWLGDSLEAVKDFSDEARREAGHQLGRVQEGEDPIDWKPMETVGAGVREIRTLMATQTPPLMATSNSPTPVIG